MPQAVNALTLAGLNLRHQRVRTLISLAGVGFAALLIFTQLGFLGSVVRTATLLFDHLDFDLLVTSREYLNLNTPDDFPRLRLSQAAAVPGVQSVRPLSVSLGLWRGPSPHSSPRDDPRRWNILILGVRPDELHLVFKDAARGIFRDREELAAFSTALSRPNAVLIDRRSWPDYGSPEDLHAGALAELNEQRLELAGNFEIGTGFGYNGLLLASEATLDRIGGRIPLHVTFGLVKLRPGVDCREVKNRLNEVLPDALAYTRDEINAKEAEYWVQETAVGRFFTLGVGVALVVGVIFVYQMMAADIRNHLAEYATVKAIGYRNRYLFRVILWQAGLLAVVGFIPGLLASLGIYELTRHTARIPIGMTAGRVVFVLLLTIGMCLCSGLLALRKLRSADPADLF
jgi:putative ABC transport system permease protein